MAGYYSLVQYMPNPKRQEGVNVGLLLLEKETGLFRWILTRPVRRVSHKFPGTCASEFEDLITRFYNTICAERVNDLDDLTYITLQDWGMLHCTNPEWIRFKPGDVEVVLHKLLEQLVL